MKKPGLEVLPAQLLGEDLSASSQAGRIAARAVPPGWV